jgi:hypothetical protein
MITSREEIGSYLRGKHKENVMINCIPSLSVECVAVQQP